MSWTRRTWMTTGAILGFLSVAAGAFAVHGITDPRAAELTRTAATYQFMHVMASFACATFMNIGARRARFAPAFFQAGILIFCGSLYAMAAGAPSWLGAITPIGGVSFLIGWAVLAWAARGVDPAPAAASTPA
jgi:uncharacterized membrane protein YgdD (TMEM256/DUF423 family)